MGCKSSKVVVAPGDGESFHELYRLGERLKEGAFGQVRNATSRSGTREAVVKIVDARRRDEMGVTTRHLDPELGQLLDIQMKVWREVSGSRFCVPLMDHYAERHVHYFVMKRYSPLADRLAGLTFMTEGDICEVFSQMLLGICFLHDRHIAHRDIKLDNYYYGGESGSTLKLGGFDSAVPVPRAGGKLKGVYGTAPYMSPEMLAAAGYDELTDMWSFGVTVYLLVHGVFPYVAKKGNGKAMMNCIHRGEPIRFDRKASQGVFTAEFVDRATAFMQRLLTRSPEVRKTAVSAREHEFLKPANDQVHSLPAFRGSGGGEASGSPLRRAAAAAPAEQPTSPAASRPSAASKSDEGAGPLASAVRRAKRATQQMSELPALLGERPPISQQHLEDLLAMGQSKYGEGYTHTGSEESTTCDTRSEASVETVRTSRRSSSVESGEEPRRSHRGSVGEAGAPRTSGATADGKDRESKRVSAKTEPEGEDPSGWFWDSHPGLMRHYKSAGNLAALARSRSRVGRSGRTGRSVW